jgi:hypothetical protein
MVGTFFRAIGFCGVDDSVHPNLLVLLARSYPIVEFGVLFRPDKEGQPRYASTEWVEQLGRVAMSPHGIPQVQLAAHLCGVRVNQVLENTDEGQLFLMEVQSWGFRRVQINATAVNGVNTSRLGESVESFCELMVMFPKLEFIIQKNEETKPLWMGLMRKDGKVSKNISMLVDESKGTGVLAKSWPKPPTNCEIGYAGGIGPHNIREVITDVATAAQGRRIWIDMESSLRSITNDKDVFDLCKCYEVIQVACDMGVMNHPSYISE